MSDRTDPSRPDVDPAGASAARPVGPTDDETAGTAADHTATSGAGYTADTGAGGAGTATFGDVTRLGFRVLLIRGIFALILGVLLFIAPAVSAAVVGTFIALAIGVWLVIDGIGTISLAFTRRRGGAQGWGWTLAGGIIALLAAVAIIVFPLTFAVVGSLLVLWLLAVGLVIQGVIEFIDTRLGGGGILLGVVNIIFGVLIGILLLTHPASSLAALVWLAGIYGIVFGIAAIVSAFRVRSAGQDVAASGAARS